MGKIRSCHNKAVTRSSTSSATSGSPGHPFGVNFVWLQPCLPLVYSSERAWF